MRSHCNRPAVSEVGTKETRNSSWPHLLTLATLLVAGSLAANPLRGETVTAEQAQAELEKDVTQGALRVVKPDGVVVECPLKHTAVEAEVSGFVARVNVKQTFRNPLNEKIEAVYVFPLPHESAVDAMTMTVGDRKIVGAIKRRAEARRIYEQALFAGQTAALLEQERPNIFTQSVGNIAPGQEVIIEISYVDVLEYDLGSYEFRFPMVVGPRYNPGSASGSAAPLPPELQGKTSPTAPNTTRVPDASRIGPPVLKPGHRTGHEVSLAVHLDAGVPVQDLSVANHRADVKRTDERKAEIVLSADDQIPNKDFVLRYKVAGKKPEMALLAHTDRQSADAARCGNGYFMLMIQPREDERLIKSPPREMVFLVDVSGSMGGQPTAKVIDAMQNMLKLCRPIDTVQVITFAGQAEKLFDKPVPVTAANIGRALNFTQGLQGAGGTEMLKGVKLAIDEPLDPERMRIVVMLTDGYIGNEAEIVEHVGKACGDRIRFWCLGIGSSPNMFLVDGVARQGGGMGRTLGLEDDTAGLTQEIMTRIQRAQLAKLQIDYGNLMVSQTYPARLPELWSGRPVIVYGRYASSGEAVVTVRGEVEGQPTSWQISVNAPQDEPAHDALAKVWARQKIEDLMHLTFYQGSPAVEEEVTGLALQYRLMSPYTSFVAVDSDTPPSAEPARPPRQMLVPVPLPEGTRWEGFFGPLGEVRELEELKQEARFGLSLATAGRGLAQTGERTADKLMKKVTALDYRAKLPALRYNRPLPSSSSALGRTEARAASAGGRFAGAMPAKPAAEPMSLRRKALFDRIDVVADLESPFPAQTAAETARTSAIAALLAEQAEPLSKAAQAALDVARQRRKDGRLAEARVEFTRAWFLAVAAGAETVANEAIESLEAVRGEEQQATIKEQPQLAKRLDMVVRNQAVDETLEIIAKAVGMQFRILPGSLEDARTLTGERDVRVSYLDLRGATVAEALDWMLVPARLEWWIDGDTILAGSARRRPGESAWIYDVGSLALPADDELPADDAAVPAKCRQAAEGFIAAIRKQLNADNVAWFSAGHLLVIGDGPQHDRVGRLLAGLSDAKVEVPAELVSLQKLTARRATAHRADDEKYLAARRRNKVAAAHAQFGWQLLSAAVGRTLDLEALTELQIAWKDPATAAMLASPARAIVMRSLWILTEAGLALPNEPELKALIDDARAVCEPAIGEAEAALKKSPNDASAFYTALFAALADRSHSPVTAALIELLVAPADRPADLQVAALLAKSLICDPAEIDKAELAKAVGGELPGDDLVVLAALACGRASPESWQTFRREADRLLGSQPLSGDVIVMINRLEAPRR